MNQESSPTHSGGWAGRGCSAAPAAERVALCPKAGTALGWERGPWSRSLGLHGELVSWGDKSTVLFMKGIPDEFSRAFYHKINHWMKITPTFNVFVLFWGVCDRSSAPGTWVGKSPAPRWRVIDGPLLYIRMYMLVVMLVKGDIEESVKSGGARLRKTYAHYTFDSWSPQEEKVCLECTVHAETKKPPCGRHSTELSLTRPQSAKGTAVL